MFIPSALRDFAAEQIVPVHIDHQAEWQKGHSFQRRFEQGVYVVFGRVFVVGQQVDLFMVSKALFMQRDHFYNFVTKMYV